MAKASRLSLDGDGSQGRRRLHLKDVPDSGSVQHETLGADLRAARLRLGEDLGSVSETLRIRREHLDAIENSAYAQLPGTTYAIGFVRSYAEFLGLDPQEAVKRFKAETGAQAEPQALAFPEPEDEARLSTWSLFGLAALLAVAIWGGYYFSSAPGTPETLAVPEVPERLQVAEPPPPGPPPTEIRHATLRAPWEPVPQPAAQPATPTPDAPSPDAPASEVTAIEPPVEDDTSMTAAAPPSADEGEGAATSPTGGQVYGAQNVDSRITIVARSDTWLRVEDQTGKVYINRTIAAGDSYRAPNRPGLILMARDAGSLDLEVDGQSVGAAGPTGMVLTGMPLNPRFLLTRGQAGQ